MTDKNWKVPKSPAARKKVEGEVENKLYLMDEKLLFAYIKKESEIAGFVVDHPKLAKKWSDNSYAAFYAMNCWPEVAERVASEKDLYYIVELDNKGQTGRDLLEGLGIEVTTELLKKPEATKAEVLVKEMSASEIGKIIAALSGRGPKKQDESLSEEQLTEQLGQMPRRKLVKAIRKFENIRQPCC